jgi:5-(carboxyamino)imidazole ribonucleotide mutase
MILRLKWYNINLKMKLDKNQVSIIMGSKSDYATMQHACKILDEFAVNYETKVVSAHRTPKRLYDFCETAKKRGIKIIIAGAGGAAHLPGMAAAITDLPVLGVPVESRALKGLDSLLSIAQMPAGIPVGCLAIGEAGAKNSALLAISILALSDKKLEKKLVEFRKNQTDSVKIDIEN